MGRTSARLVVPGVLIGWVLAALPTPARAQEVKAEKVVIKTADGVELHGSFYPTAKRNTPTILMLHALGKDSRNAEWQALAEAMAKKGYAVLTFDFRGHGNSTKVNPQEFWLNPTNAVNRTMVSGFNQLKPKELVEFKDFKSRPGYFPYLVNDIAAAKVFLDRKNDAGECNTHSLVLVGADAGAALGGLWLRSEWMRYGVMNNGFQTVANKNPEGKDVIAALWLSPSPYVGSQPVDYRSLLGLQGLKTTPMVFAYGDGDQSAKNVSKTSEPFFKGDKKSPSYKLTWAFEVKGAKKLRGSDLLKSSLGLTEQLVEYIDQLAESRTENWAEQSLGKSNFAWVIPGRGTAPVNMRGGQMPFTDYSMFLPR